MKNYLQIFYVEEFDNTDTLVGASFLQSQQEAIDYNASLQGTLPPGWYTTGPFMFYRLLSKRQMYELQAAVAFGSDPFNDSYNFTQDKTRADKWGVTDPQWQFDEVDKRSAENNKIAVERVGTSTAKKTGDLSGAAGLFLFFQNLALYAAQLRASGRLRDAGIVQFAYDQVSKQLWSITQAFDFLRKNNLL